MTVITAAAGEALLTLQEAVDLGYGGYSTLRKYIADGKLTASKVGARVKIRRADLDALLTPAAAPSYESAEAAIRRIVAVAPPLSGDQLRKLGRVLMDEAAARP
ncbi:helix-turn-helix domain-containing protein [Gordonia iterans]